MQQVEENQFSTIKNSIKTTTPFKKLVVKNGEKMPLAASPEERVKLLGFLAEKLPKWFVYNEEYAPKVGGERGEDSFEFAFFPTATLVNCDPTNSVLLEKVAQLFQTFIKTNYDLELDEITDPKINQGQLQPRVG